MRGTVPLLAVGALAAASLSWGQSTAPATSPSRHSPAPRRAERPTLSEDEYQALAAELRQSYSQPSDKWPAPAIDPGVEFSELSKLPPPVYPANNPYAKNKDDLGRELFFDPRLSGSGQIACASCHDPDLAWADGRTVSFGHARTQLRRNAPSVLFAAYAKTLFWDGRAGSLEDQAQIPVLAHDEMNASANTVMERLNAIPEYRRQFQDVFGNDTITLENVARSIATFERGITRYAGRSEFDRFLGGQTDALNDQAIRGLHLFRTTARCINCHNGPAFTDNQFHDEGLSYYGRQYEDLGRFYPTNNPKDVGKFRTPSLRNVARTRPYTHNGLLELDGLIAAYNNGMPTLRRSPEQLDDEMFPTKDPLLKPLGLNVHDRADLHAFLESLSEPVVRIRPPKLPAAVATAKDPAATP
jgi:cytochrome c peroxidase